MNTLKMKSDDDVLNELLHEAPERSENSKGANPKSTAECSGDYWDEAHGISGTSDEETKVDFRQWQVGGNDTFRPAGITRETIPPGVYCFDRDDNGLFAKKIKVITDNLIELPDNSSERVLRGMEKFWQMEERYHQHGLLYKRGILLWGPPGSGKTATISLLNKYLLDNGGVVVMCDHPKITSMGLEAFRRIEPTRRIICIMEDIDEIIDKYGEHDLLALLDGENQVDRIVMLATTNYPDKLGARIVNRPSRFDERILVDMPSSEARHKYLSHLLGTIPEIDKWVADTNGLSIAHLREMTAAVRCLDQDYDEVLSRLKSMKHKIKTIDGQEGKTGF
jgi:Cdc6-like AAA superfamily ATPase